MRLRRRKAQVTVRLLWDRNVVVAFVIFVDGEYVGNVPLLPSAGAMAFTTDNVSIEHGGDRA